MKHGPDSEISLAEVASTFAALGSEQRLSVLRTLVRAGPEGLSIGEVGARCDVSGSTLTHHMKILSQAGLVQQAKHGRTVICFAARYPEMEALSKFLLKECCADAGDAVKGPNKDV
ncbi:MAG: metalloregulator ArsR/SmtB family transcription factor [Pseudomonadota bacterium]